MGEERSAKGSTVTPGERGLEQTFGRAAIILNALATSGDSGMRFVDIVRATGMSQTTVHRLVSALAEHGFIELSNRTSRYFLGMQLAGWAFAAMNRFGIAEIAHAIIHRLCESTGDTVYLSLRTGDAAICVSRIEGSYPIHVRILKPGDRQTFGLGAGSLALLAFIREDAEIERLLNLPEQRTGRARVGVDDTMIRQWLATSRREGFSMVRDMVPGTSAVALPICDPSGDPIAAVGLAAISARLETPRLKQVLREMRAAAAEIEAKLRPILKANPTR